MFKVKAVKVWCCQAWSLLRNFLFNWAEPLSKWATIIAIIAGGVWAYYNYRITDTDVSNAEIIIVTEVIPYTDNTRLLVVHVKPRNIGKVPIPVTGDGLSLTLKKIPKDVKEGHIDFEKLPTVYDLQGIERKYGGYILEPSVEFDEVETFILPRGDTYLIESEMDLGEGWAVGADHVLKID